MTYTDSEGKNASDYKTLILGDFSQRELDLRDDWYSLVASIRAGITTGQQKEYKLTFSENLPTSGAYIKVLMAIMMDNLEDGLNYAIESMKLLNKLFTLPSGVTILGPNVDHIDWTLFTEPYQSVKCKYITGVYYRTQGSSDEWVALPLTHNQIIPSVNVNLAYDTGSYLIWNHSTFTNYFLAYALGKEIEDEWGLEDGIDKTITWVYATEETPPRYLKGDHAYWTTHGFPNGRKYRIVRDFILYDYRVTAWSSGFIILLFYLGLPKKLIAKIVSIISNKMKMGKLLAPSNEILDRLDVGALDPDTFKSLESIFEAIFDIKYKPYGR